MVFHKKHKLGFRWFHDNQGSNYRMTEIQAVIGRYQLKRLNNQIKKRNLIAKKIINSLKLFWNKFSLISEPNFRCSSCVLKNLKKKCNNCTHAFYRLNFFINLNKKEKINLLKDFNKTKINCNEGPCPEIYKEKLFKKLKIYPPEKLINAIKLGEKSLAYHINPFSSSKKLRNDIKNLKKILLKYKNV